jgi:uncharacterized surface protein with fasciclin (FAS1) repeats
MKITALLASTALLVAPAAFAGDCSWSKAKQTTAKYEQSEARYVGNYGEKADIVETAKAAGSFGTLLAAAEAAGLVGALQGEGPLTVFAPTDAAFAALPEGTVESLLLPENKDALAGILKLHVIAGKVMSKDLAGTTTVADTLNGSVTVDGTDGVKVIAAGSTATVITADVKASNGIIHVIDTVLLPAG